MIFADLLAGDAVFLDAKARDLVANEESYDRRSDLHGRVYLGANPAKEA